MKKLFFFAFSALLFLPACMGISTKPTGLATPTTTKNLVVSQPRQLPFQGRYGYSAVVQGDGSVIVAGVHTKASPAYFSLLRVASNETLDASFQPDDELASASPIKAEYFAKGMINNTEGNIWVVGSFYPAAFHRLADSSGLLVGYKPDGTLQRFGSHEKGFLTYKPSNGQAFFTHVKIQEGHLLVAGVLTQFSSGTPSAPDVIISQAFVRRYTLDGQLDDSFGNKGMALVGKPTSHRLTVSDLLALPAGDFLIGLQEEWDRQGGGMAASLWRLDEDASRPAIDQSDILADKRGKITLQLGKDNASFFVLQSPASNASETSHLVQYDLAGNKRRLFLAPNAASFALLNSDVAVLNMDGTLNLYASGNNTPQTFQIGLSFIGQLPSLHVLSGGKLGIFTADTKTANQITYQRISLPK